MRSGRASDPRLVAGAFAIYASAKRAGQLNGELFGNQLDQLLKSEYDILKKEIINLEEKFMHIRGLLKLIRYLENMWAILTDIHHLHWLLKVQGFLLFNN